MHVILQCDKFLSSIECCEHSMKCSVRLILHSSTISHCLGARVSHIVVNICMHGDVLCTVCSLVHESISYAVNHSPSS